MPVKKSIALGGVAVVGSVIGLAAILRLVEILRRPWWQSDSPALPVADHEYLAQLGPDRGRLRRDSNEIDTAAPEDFPELHSEPGLHPMFTLADLGLTEEELAQFDSPIPLREHPTVIHRSELELDNGQRVNVELQYDPRPARSTTPSKAVRPQPQYPLPSLMPDFSKLFESGRFRDWLGEYISHLDAEGSFGDVHQETVWERLSDAFGLTPNDILRWYLESLDVERSGAATAAPYPDIQMGYAYVEANNLRKSGLVLVQAVDRLHSYADQAYWTEANGDTASWIFQLFNYGNGTCICGPRLLTQQIVQQLRAAARDDFDRANKLEAAAHRLSQVGEELVELGVRLPHQVRAELGRLKETEPSW